MENTLQQQEEPILKAYSKCLIMGGYSIVFNEAIGISLSLEDYFTTKHKFIEKTFEFDIEIITNQFINHTPVHLFHSHKTYHSYNPFVEVPLKISLNYLKNLHPDIFKEKFEGKSLIIETLQTQGFINKKHLVWIPYNEKVPQFPNYKDHLTVCEKTGIGSSACTVVILVKTIFKIFGCEENLDEIHLIAQISNSIAQKKIGSGFDITTSVYGSNIFTRIDKNLLEELIAQYEKFLSMKESVNYIEFGKFKDMILQTKNVIKSKFVQEFDENYEVIMVNWNQGFDTRIAVKNVLNFFEKDEEKKLEFLKDSAIFVNSVKEILLENEEECDFVKLRKLNYEYRMMMKRLGNDSGVEIEPDIASFILDFYLKKSEKIVFGVCPGAGGYDDLALLVRKGDKETVVEEMKNLDFKELLVTGEKSGLEVCQKFAIVIEEVKEDIEKVVFDFK